MKKNEEKTFARLHLSCWFRPERATASSNEARGA